MALPRRAGLRRITRAVQLRSKGAGLSPSPKLMAFLLPTLFVSFCSQSQHQSNLPVFVHLFASSVYGFLFHVPEVRHWDNTRVTRTIIPTALVSCSSSACFQGCADWKAVGIVARPQKIVRIPKMKDLDRDAS